jgi:acyl-CoA reductase-like NAD-dependent aldehyde dehydrogenase
MKMIIGEEYVDSSSGEVIEVINPYDGSLVDTVPAATTEDIDKAISYAVAAQKEWKKVPVYKRVELVKRFLKLVDENRDDLARTLSLESGKNITEVGIEMNNIHTAWNAFSEKIKHKYDEVIPNGLEFGHDKNIVITRREPIGVVACIIPFNFPCNLFNQKVAPALLCGNAAIVKPATNNPLTICKLVGLLREAGFPAGVVQVVTGRGSTVGNHLAESPQINAVSLTGSTMVGLDVAQTAARTLKTVALELGGNDAFIVLEDADFELAVSEAVNARFFNAGQICCAPKRFLIHKSMYKQFVDEVVKRVSTIKSGNPLDADTRIGTVISEDAAKTVEQQINLTVEQGGKIVLGGHRNGAFVEPTIIADVPFDADIMHDLEVFGPVMPIASFDNEDEALNLANDTMYGLGGSIFTKDMHKAMYFTNEFECGSVVINGSSYFRSFEMPFGGYKQSGLGTEGVYSTFDEFTTIKCISLKGIM